MAGEKIAIRPDYNDVSIVFKISPDTLLNLAVKVVDALPLPSVYTWTIEDICRWLRSYGYPQYQRTFRDNLVNGHTLLLIDAAALTAMNISNFDHIKHIAYGIRNLYFFELMKFGRSISLAPEYHFELYKQFRVKTGRIYDTTKRSELWRHMQLIRKQRKYLDHWQALEQHLSITNVSKSPEIVGCPRGCNQMKPRSLGSISTYENPAPSKGCSCLPPCDCHWKPRELQSNLYINSSTFIRTPSLVKNRMEILEEVFPQKYGNILKEIYVIDAMSHIVRFKANKTSVTRDSILGN